MDEINYTTRTSKQRLTEPRFKSRASDYKGEASSFPLRLLFLEVEEGEEIIKSRTSDSIRYKKNEMLIEVIK
jgi:hypothetical protein